MQQEGYVFHLVSFNPYSDGYCSEIRQRSDWNLREWMCFNPYSDGYCSEILMMCWLPSWEKPSFNPYSDGYCSEMPNELPVDCRQSMFQSLFWWILLWNKEMWAELFFIDSVSILILMDIALKYGTPQTISFHEESFNPYSDGYCSEIPKAKAFEVPEKMFQSLFWWILLWN